MPIHLDFCIYFFIIFHYYILYTGALDATYIRLTTNPKKDETSYMNRKNFPAVSLQVVCDANMRILDASTGWPSSMHDSRIFRKSFIGLNIDKLLVDTDYFLLADGGYTLHPRVMIPYRSDHPLDEVKSMKKSNVET